jgi:hypothetical protein
MNTTDQSSAEFQAAFEQAAADLRGDTAPAPAAEPASEPQAPQLEQPAAESQEAPQDDELSKLRRELEETRHRERSASARVSAFHRKLNSVQQELDSLRKPAPAAAPAAAADEEDADLKAAMDEMPEVAKLVERLVEKRSSARIAQVEEKVEQAVSPLREDAERRAAQVELSVVEKEFPNWNELVFSEPFQTWKDGLPPAMRQAWDNASTGADALAFLRMHQRDTAPAAAAPAPTKQDKLAKAVGLPSRSTGTQSGMPASDDFQANFEFFAKQNRRA